MKANRLVAPIVLALGLSILPAAAQDYPTKPVRIVVTFPPGGSSDVTARALSVPLQKALGQPVVVDNKPGAGGTIAATEIFRAAPDGYNLMMSNTTPISLAPFMLNPQPYDSIKGFTHVSLVATVPDVVMVHPSVPAKSLAELIDWVKAQNKKVFYGSGGVGSIGHILGETFKKQTGLNIEHVGYRGSAPMITDLIAGRLSFSFDTLPQNVPHIKAGKLRPLAVTSRARSHVAPDIQTVVEAGMPYLVAENFIGVSAPANLPEPVLSRLHAAIQKSLDDPDLVARLRDLGLTVQKMSQPEFTAFVSKQVEGWAEPVKASGAKLN
ncbi:Bug family tripartite tricarboxylate transporter substrate binding protein [Pseudorhodoplanes sp.]|uniref:Bug family tripartite tricarboxylate transporter substrate binding protein n=1 Tax=Pseudorhodoplanes sp. TaxID=1934341 RepID=UPI003D0BF278